MLDVPVISIVAPMHNEEANVQTLYESIGNAMADLHKPYEILFVNDASTDHTLSMLKRIQSCDSHFHFVDLEFNVGENWALLAGVSKARGNIIVTIDGDGQNDPAYIPAILDELSKGYRVVSGRRRARSGSFWTRRLPSLVANTLIRVISGVPVHDCGCGLKAYRREVVEGRYLPKGFMNRFSPVILGVKQKEFSEVEIMDRARKSGRSHYGLSRVFVVLRDLASLPFAIQEPGKWLRRFRSLQWAGLAAGLPLAISGWKLSALGTILLVLVSFSNARNLKRFVVARAAPEFRIQEFK
jgi:glycosyltransferase involved in cell wall biosynthesis